MTLTPSFWGKLGKLLKSPLRLITRVWVLLWMYIWTAIFVLGMFESEAMFGINGLYAGTTGMISLMWTMMVFDEDEFANESFTVFGSIFLIVTLMVTLFGIIPNIW